MQPFPGNPQHGQPPAQKKYKTASGAVVTQYAPPPGYVPPPSVQQPATPWPGAYGVNPYAQQQAYAQYWQQYQQAAAGYAGYQGYPANGWQQSYGYPQSQYPGQTVAAPDVIQQHAQQGYPPNTNFPVPNLHSQQSSQAIGSSSAVTILADSPHHSAPDSGQGFARPSLPASVSFQDDKSRAASQTWSIASDPASTRDDHQPAHEFDEIDFCREASFMKDGETVQPDLSLGTIVYYPARLMRTALAATFQEAELELIAPKAREGEDESLSKYFIASKLGEVDLSVRQIEDEWKEVKDDMIFREYPAKTTEYVSVISIKADRERPDPDPSSRYPPHEEEFVEQPPVPKIALEEPQGTEQTPTIEPVQSEVNDDESDDAEMDLSSDDDGASDEDATAVTQPAQVPVVQNISADAPTSKRAAISDPPQSSARRLNDKANGTARKSPPLKRPQSYRERSPRRGPHQGQKYSRDRDEHRWERRRYSPPSRRPYDDRYDDRFDGHYDDRRRSSSHAQPFGPHNVPPPPEAEDWDNPWRRMDGVERRGSNASNGSHHTVPADDFDGRNDLDKTPDGKSAHEQNGSGRKRGYDEMERSYGHRGSRQEDDSRQRRFRPKVAEAYSRRW